MQFTKNNYYSAMDRLDNTEFFASNAPVELDEEGNPLVPDDSLNFTPKEIGTTTNPMGNTLDSLKAKIREGTSRIEFSFIGQGKGNSQQPTPESFGTREREDIRELLRANEMKTSTHASVHSQSLAGFTQRGFNDEARSQVLNEIKKAIHFAGEATKGGAIVFHMQEWQRPLSHLKDKSGAQFEGYTEEDKDAVLFAVDNRTGELVSTISKNREVYRPVYLTAKDVNKIGQKDDFGNVLRENDWIDVHGNRIAKDASPEVLFNRVPKFNSEKTNFEVQKLQWDDLVKETDEWNKNNPKTARTPEEMFAILEVENRVLTAKGNSLYHAQQYEETKHSRDELLDEYKMYKEVETLTPENERWKLKSKFLGKYRGIREDDNPDDFYKRQIKDIENRMRHIHEASASSDVMAKQAEETINHIESAKKYGLKRTADTIAKAAIYAMDTYNRNKDKFGLEDPIYLAPENWDPKMFGSHPEEYAEAIESSRTRMVELLKMQGKDESDAKKLAETHIKGTLDIGHLNLFREHYKGDPKNFDKWILSQAKNLVEKGYVSHIHLTDNFGFDDEHLTPGQGNVPMKAFLKEMEKLGVKDLIVEPGSYNPTTAMYDTLSMVNSPVYGISRRTRFRNVHEAHFGYTAPGFFIAGAYVPSNDWKPWTDIPLE
ncbi:hypothetical protein COV13_03000 [Candidatus Woesearchaeota archaeon CG10_big_fil_rev_8_21_14_0_10_32_9]|nr:MAG: hypothetical protein COV13_03000 [Candidatus Woesearchaeota archaeon CG10_big_fil_rev_8_21_14_0_10_32_9]